MKGKGWGARGAGGRERRYEREGIGDIFGVEEEREGEGEREKERERERERKRENREK